MLKHMRANVICVLMILIQKKKKRNFFLLLKIWLTGWGISLVQLPIHPTISSNCMRWVSIYIFVNSHLVGCSADKEESCICLPSKSRRNTRIWSEIFSLERPSNWRITSIIWGCILRICSYFYRIWKMESSTKVRQRCVWKLFWKKEK